MRERFGPSDTVLEMYFSWTNGFLESWTGSRNGDALILQLPRYSGCILKSCSDNCFVSLSFKSLLQSVLVMPARPGIGMRGYFPPSKLTC